MKLLLLLVILLFLYIIIIRSPNKISSNGSGGLSPSGGMRDARMYQADLSDRNVTYNDYMPQVYDTGYDIPEPTVISVGHWGGLMI